MSYPLVPKDFGFFAKLEIMDLIDTVAQKFPIMKKTEILVNPFGHNGLILIDFRPLFYQLDSEEIKAIREEIESIYSEWRSKNKLRHINRFLIIDVLVETDISKIVNAVMKLRNKIRGKWRITLKTRKYPIDREELIRRVAEPINEPVDLRNPEYIVWIEIISNLTAIAIIKKNQA